ncbi:DUF1574 domain-containing protein [Geitlerinema splendidum]|nr:DUF1574 domain-containing protein [Geitlerinema splendidum]
MLDTNERTQAPLAQWVQQTIGLHQGRVKVQLQGNNLHILCEAPQCPEATATLAALKDGLKTTPLETLLPQNQAPVYKITIYGRTIGPNYPDWTEILDLTPRDAPFSEHGSIPNGESEEKVLMLQAARTAHQNDKAIAIENPEALDSNNGEGTALLVSNRTLARQGCLDAIAWVLSETLSPLGVSVRVKVKPPRKSKHPDRAHQRLHVLCESTYSPDPTLLAPTIAQQLRELNLQGFRDAVISCQVTGEATPDWLLRVDLTPNEVMLREWGRWGDVPAISRLLNQALAQQEVQVSAILKESTLHLFCTAPTAPDRQVVTATLKEILESLTPQGIFAATLYGHVRASATPVWVDWLDMPAKQNPALAPSTLTLAEQGDREALTFLLTRLLNPDLDQQLLTGGIQTQVARKEDLLHLMSDAPVCPAQNDVGPLVAKFLQQLKVPGVAGVRVYGRRSGQKLPRWSYGVDFVPRQRLVPEASPEFAASSSYVGDLLSETGEFNAPPAEAPVPESDRALQQVARLAQLSLVRSGLMAPVEERSDWEIERKPNSEPLKKAKIGHSALIWGAAGLVLALQVDWVWGSVLQQRVATSRQTAPSVQTGEVDANVTWPPVAPEVRRGAPGEGFEDAGFTRPASGMEMQLQCPEGQSGEDCVLSPVSPYPSFNNSLLDEQLSRYHQRMLESGPPDVLIVGSSRALRGIDPVALREALAAQGYADISVYNFGVNGATAQVVDLIVRRILTAEQLPKLILWADGARAFNSGRGDATYNAIATSAGYQSLMAGTLALPTYGAAEAAQPTAEPAEAEFSLAEAYRQADRWLDERIGALSALYPERDRAKGEIAQKLADILPNGERAVTQASEPEDDSEAQLDRNGFLALSVRFNPLTYYQKHPRVTGDYDRDYESFQLEGRQTEALESLLQVTQQHSIPLVFINLPLTSDYLDPVRASYEREFTQQMLRFAMERGFIFRDLANAWDGGQMEYFSDPSHLNRYGAMVVAQQIARDPMISWPSR